MLKNVGSDPVINHRKTPATGRAWPSPTAPRWRSPHWALSQWLSNTIFYGLRVNSISVTFTFSEFSFGRCYRIRTGISRYINTYSAISKTEKYFEERCEWGEEAQFRPADFNDLANLDIMVCAKIVSDKDVARMQSGNQNPVDVFTKTTASVTRCIRGHYCNAAYLLGVGEIYSMI